MSISIRSESMRTNTWNRICVRAGSKMPIVLAALLFGMLTAAGAAHATDNQNNDACMAETGMSCGYEIEYKAIEKVPPFFKFQSRISQAKLPVGDVEFSKIIVNVKDGTSTPCTETFNNVMVRDSILNLTIGHNMSCELADIIAKSAGLTFQICIGGEENCLKPVTLNAVPYAIKSSYAQLSEKAHVANEAAVCHFAHLLSAEHELMENPMIGIGYHDFHTPMEQQIIDLFADYDDGVSVQSQYFRGGYIQWMQVDSSPGNLHIAGQARGSANRAPERLGEVLLHSDLTHALGQVAIDGPDPNAQLRPVMGKSLTVTRSGIDVHGKTDMYDNVSVGAFDQGAQAGAWNMTIQNSHELHDYGEAFFYNHVTMGTEVDENLVCDINHKLTVDGPAYYSNYVKFGEEGTLDTKYYEIYHTTTAHGEVNIGTNDRVDGNNCNINHKLNVDGTSDFNNHVTMGDDGSPYTCDINHSLDVTGRSLFTGEVFVDGVSHFTKNANFESGIVKVADTADKLDVYADAYFQDVEFKSGYTATFNGIADFNGNVIFGNDQDPNGDGVIDVWNRTTFHGTVIIDNEDGIQGGVGSDSVGNDEINNTDDFTMSSLTVTNSSGNSSWGIHSTGASAGVYAEGGGTGITAVANNAGGIGVNGIAQGIGVKGYSNDGDGVGGQFSGGWNRGAINLSQRTNRLQGTTHGDIWLEELEFGGNTHGLALCWSAPYFLSGTHTQEQTYSACINISPYGGIIVSGDYADAAERRWKGYNSDSSGLIYDEDD